MPVPRGSIPAMPSAASGTTPVFFTALAGLAAHRAAHRPGQYLLVGMEIDGVRHWRTYSITSPPKRRPGTVLRLGPAPDVVLLHCAPGPSAASSRCSKAASASCGPANCTVNRAS